MASNSPYSVHYRNKQLDKGRLRKFVRGFYLRHTLKYVNGRSVDFGCGIGDLLKKLPSGSVGFEINDAAVDYCKNLGLNVMLYKPEIDKYQLSDLKVGKFETLVVSHVLEHLENPAVILKLLFNACIRLGIKKVVVALPGLKGFMMDMTHQTFIDDSYLEKFDLTEYGGFYITLKKYFPSNNSRVGDFFAYNELFIVYDRE